MSIDQGTGGHLINGSTQILRGDPQKSRKRRGRAGPGLAARVGTPILKRARPGHGGTLGHEALDGDGRSRLRQDDPSGAALDADPGDCDAPDATGIRSPPPAVRHPADPGVRLQQCGAHASPEGHHPVPQSGIPDGDLRHLSGGPGVVPRRAGPGSPAAGLFPHASPGRSRTRPAQDDRGDHGAGGVLSGPDLARNHGEPGSDGLVPHAPAVPVRRRSVLRTPSSK